MPIRRPRIARTGFLPAALLALGASACIAVPLATATTIEFHDAPSTAASNTPIDLGLPAAPIGFKGTIKFSYSAQDKRAIKAAKDQEQLRTQSDSYRKASLLAGQRIADIQELLADAQDDQDKLRAEIEERMVARYKDGEAGDLEYLFSGDGLSDVVGRADLLKDQSAKDKRIYAQYELTIQRIEDYEAVLEELQDMTGDQAQRLDERATRLDDVLVAAKVGHDEAPIDEPTTGQRKKGLDGTWYIMDGAFQAQLFLPGASGSYDGGNRTPRRKATTQEIQRILSDPAIELDASGIQDIVTGQIDGRLIDALILAGQQFHHVKVTSMKSDHGVMTSSGNVSEHSYGCAADIGTIGSTYITPSAQTPGSEVEQAVLFFNSLGTTSGHPDLAPHQVISLFSLGGATLALPDHGDHIHLGYAC